MLKNIPIVESKFKDFFRSPAGILLTIFITMLIALGVLFLTSRVFQRLLTPQPFPFE